MYKDFAQFVFFIKLILFFNFCDIMLYYNNSHGQNEVNQVKKKTLVPLITFLLGICLISLIVYKTDTHEKEQRHITAQLNVATYGEQIKNEITNGIEITDTLKQILISEDGKIHQFETIAGNLMSDSIESVQLAPNGVVTDIYPANENEAGKIDLIHDKDRGKISCYARDNHTIITQGPFKLKQGGYGIAVRNPIYLKDKNGHEYFWGFTIVILRVPDIFSDSISALSNFGYEYKISKTDAPWSDTYKVVYQSDGQINRPVSYTFTIGDENWKFEVTPKSGWRNATLLVIIIGIFLTISLLLSVLTRVWLVAKEHKKKFQILARTDSLTNIYNRYGFDEFAEKMIQKNPKTHFVAALLDIDDFKFINKTYGVENGDTLLRQIGAFMETLPFAKTVFRLGADQFCIVLYKDLDQIDAVAQTVHERFRHPWYSENQAGIMMSASICCVNCPTDASAYGQLIEVMDYSMSMAKRLQKGRITYAKDYDLGKIKQDKAFEKAVKQALDRDELMVYYQPIFSVEKGVYNSAEALVRLHDEELGWISPEDFIPIAERNGMIIEMGEVILDKVCRFIHDFKLAQTTVEYIEVNISPVQLMQQHFSDRVKQIMEKYDVRPNQINIEITETATISMADTVNANIMDLVQYGIKFSLDDYGSGYANIEYINHMPFSIIKLDKYIIWDAFKSTKAGITLKHTIGMLNELELHIVAEGVETAEMRDHLADIGCHFMQGWYYSKAVSDQDFIRLIEMQ